MLRILDSLGDVSANEWNSLVLGDPFVRHEFLFALEQTGCATPATGWVAKHLFLRDANGKPLGAAPLYLKTHSWGEFVFDFSWANAYARLGLPYYPKLICAVPFTPATGPRLLVARDSDGAAVRDKLLSAMQNLASDALVSSVHLLFCDTHDHDLSQNRQFLSRQDCQFHWHNRDYRNFDAFIATFRADKRKKLLRERRRVHEAGIHFEIRTGAQMSDADWQLAYALSENTFARHGHEHYLNVEFFTTIALQMPATVVVI
ncbi:MAG: N-acetyltransferase, partial [Candidatus Obscuribacterales bacterium]|nr:N-acetyltransferase [Steroidobacteraceae bacterium]